MADEILKVASSDFDGVFSNKILGTLLPKYPNRNRQDLLIESNLLLLNYLDAKGIDLMMIGSNRQDIKTDFQNAQGDVSSIFTDFPELCAAINTEFSPFVLADLYNDAPDGTTYKKALELLNGVSSHQYPEDFTNVDVEKESVWVFDDHKVSIVYAQIQKLALENPDRQIEYSFIDDRENILIPIENFFKNHPELIPGNITIKTVHCACVVSEQEPLGLKMEIKERGSLKSNSPTTAANPHYKDTLKSWARNNAAGDGITAGTDDQVYPKLAEEHQFFLSNPPFTYRAITANCANDTLGVEACSQIGELLKQDQGLDFVVINCQEANFEKTRRELEQMAEAKGYKVQCIAQMPTHTTASSQLLANSGIASFIIHKADLAIEANEAVIARRTQNRFSGTPYNKGGVVTDFKVIRTSNPSQRVNIQSISGHLDSKIKQKRNDDWLNLHKASAKDEVNSWEDLVAASPNLRISGYDANTRDKLEGGIPVNLLKNRPDSPEVQVFFRAPFADRTFSKDVTYGHSSNEDPKRPGDAAQGMLDHVGIYDGSPTKESERLSTEQVIKVDVEKSTKRDHAVIISPKQEYYASIGEFARVKEQIISRLRYVAPNLANNVFSLDESPGNKKTLMQIYNDYLSPNGVLSKAIELHSQKIGIYEQLMGASFLKDEQVKHQVTTTLFANPHWCDGTVATINAKQRLMSVLIESLSNCKHEAGIQARLDLHSQLENEFLQLMEATKKPDNASNRAKLIQDYVTQLDSRFKDLAVDEYLNSRNHFEETLAVDLHPGSQFQSAGQHILESLDAISPSNPENLRTLDLETLDLLTRTTGACEKAYASSNKGQAPQMIKELVELSNESGGSSFKPFQLLKSALNKFIAFAAKAVGISPEALSTFYSKEVELSDSIKSFKTELKKQTTDEFKYRLEDLHQQDRDDSQEMDVPPTPSFE